MRNEVVTAVPKVLTGAKGLKELRAAAIKDIQKRYEADGQTEALRLAYKKYGAMGTTHLCTGCECESLFIDDQCVVCGGVLPKPPKEYYIKFVADDGYVHFAKLVHATKTQKQLESDWDKSIKQAKQLRGIEWNHSDALVFMKAKGWKHEGINTVQLDY